MRCDVYVCTYYFQIAIYTEDKVVKFRIIFTGQILIDTYQVQSSSVTSRTDLFICIQFGVVPDIMRS